MVQNRGLILKSVPVGIPILGRDLTVESREFDIEQEPPKGGVITKNQYASLNHYQRLLMNDEVIPLHYEPYKIDEPITNNSIAKVLKSNSPYFTEGNLVRGMLPIEEYSVLSRESAKGFDIIENPQELDIKLFLGPLGMPGITAYSSFYDFGKPSAGETIFVSSATGSVGQLIGQFATRANLNTFGSVGSNDELDYILDELRFDGGFNYNEENLSDAITRLMPQGIDIYYENASGELLDAVLDAMNKGGRIITAGVISEYRRHQCDRYVLEYMMCVVSKEITIRSCLCPQTSYATFYRKDIFRNILRMIETGGLKYIYFAPQGIENAGSAFVEMLEDQSFGTVVLRIQTEGDVVHSSDEMSLSDPL